ncbi:coiled-coil alpha-helical rod protein 1 isoform X1 [Hypanus sabinus]|uniref:coiled-coil alpha-helical rod protein 1 isoform X1 n=1 Tax=Hypanus sabinus TaxID=79690 RepID=UPI0028C3D809|nr:coiled-coil alpha-helical rod protein 1 isoform X1 [Hypanus sabinus]
MSERPGRGLEPPAAFGGKIGPEDLIPPSHFSSRTHAPPPVDTNPWAALAKATKDILELRQENECLRRGQRSPNRGCCKFEKERVCNRDRLSEQERSPPSHELARRAEERREASQLEAGLLRDRLAQQVATVAEKDHLLACLGEQLGELRAELQRLGAAPRQHRRWDEMEDQRRESQAVQEQDHSPLEAGKQQGEPTELRRRAQRGGSTWLREDTSRDNHLQLATVPKSLDGDLEALRRRVTELEEELQQSQEKSRGEAARLRATLETTAQERDALQEELSKARGTLESQGSLIRQLRTYIGQLVPDEKQLEEARQEKEWLSSRVQHLEKERETLRATSELLNVRLTSLMDIVTIQESDRCGKPTLDVQSGDNRRKASMVTRWREKVFALMVQLKSQEISHTNDINRLQVKVAHLEEDLAMKGQEHAVLVHSLQDRTAEVGVERVKNQSLRDELADAQNNVVRFQEMANRADGALHNIQDQMSSFYQRFLEQEALLKTALCQLVNLSQRVTFANKRIDTIHGLCARKEALARLQLQERDRETGGDVGRRPYEDLEKELELLNGERDQLAAELKRNSQLIERKVTEARLKFEADLKEELAVRGRLEEALAEETRQQQRLTERLSEAQQELKEAREDAERLKADLCRQQAQYEEALREKMADVEKHAAEQLREMEKRLNEARREHTKAVVTLRQTDRQAVRDKERLESCAKLQEEQHQRETQQLSEQLRELQRDKNLLVATLRQEGLLSQFRKSRAVAVHMPTALSDQSKPTRAPAQSPASRARGSDLTKDSLAEVLEELQVLSAAVTTDEEEREITEEEEEEIQ